MKYFILILHLLACVHLNAQKCKFKIEENVSESENIVLETQDLVLFGLAPNNISISFQRKGLSYMLLLDYLYIDNSGVNVNGVSLPKTDFPKIKMISESSKLIFHLAGGQKVILSSLNEITSTKHNLTKSSTKYVFENLNFIIPIEDLELLSGTIVDAVEIQYFSFDDNQNSSRVQLSETRDQKIKNYINCLLSIK